MKIPHSFRRPLLLAVLFLSTALPAIAQATHGTIIARVVAFRSASGHIDLSLYDKERDFPDHDMRMITKRADVKNSSVVELRFENVPFGTYAIAGHHDENRSGGMDYNWIGLPKEGYCFSNNAKPVFSPPSFSEAKFKLDKPVATVYITMQY